MTDIPDDSDQVSVFDVMGTKALILAMKLMKGIEKHTAEAFPLDSKDFVKILAVRVAAIGDAGLDVLMKEFIHELANRSLKFQERNSETGREFTKPIELMFDELIGDQDIRDDMKKISSRLLAREGENAAADLIVGEAPSLPLSHSNKVTARTVMLVEDEEDQRCLLEEIIRSLDFTPIAVSSGEEALKVLKTGYKIDLVLTDIVLVGGIGGFTVAQKARQLQPNIAILYMSAYAGFLDDPNETDIKARLLVKPFSAQALLKAINQAISERQDRISIGYESQARLRDLGSKT